MSSKGDSGYYSEDDTITTINSDESIQSDDLVIVNHEVNMNEAVEEENTLERRYAAQSSNKNARRKLISRLSTCNGCGHMGLYLHLCEKCGIVCESLDKKTDDDELHEDSRDISYCHRCGKIGMFATRCSCEGYCLVPIKREDPIIGSLCKCCVRDKVGTFGKVCMCGNLFLKPMNASMGEVNMVTITNDESEEFLADTGATTHIIRENKFMYKRRSANLCGMNVGTGDVTRVTEKGELRVMDENGTDFVLNYVHVVPGITRNIISITQMLREGWKLGGTREKLTVTKENRI